MRQLLEDWRKFILKEGKYADFQNIGSKGLRLQRYGGTDAKYQSNTAAPLNVSRGSWWFIWPAWDWYLVVGDKEKTGGRFIKKPSEKSDNRKPRPSMKIVQEYYKGPIFVRFKVKEKYGFEWKGDEELAKFGRTPEEADREGAWFLTHTDFADKIMPQQYAADVTAYKEFAFDDISPEKKQAFIQNQPERYNDVISSRTHGFSKDNYEVFVPQDKLRFNQMLLDRGIKLNSPHSGKIKNRLPKYERP